MAGVGRCTVRGWRVEHLPLVITHVVMHIPVRQRKVVAFLAGCVEHPGWLWVRYMCESLWLDGKLSMSEAAFESVSSWGDMLATTVLVHVVSSKRTHIVRLR